MRKVLVNFPFWIGTKPAERPRKELEPAIEKNSLFWCCPSMNQGPATSFQKETATTYTVFLGFLGTSSSYLRIFYVVAIFFPLSKILNAKMHANMLWRRLRLVHSISLNFSFCQNETAVSFDGWENFSTFHEKLNLFLLFKC